MDRMNRRSAMRAAGAVAAGAALGGTAAGDEPKAPKLWTLEGELKIHPKFRYRYYLVLLGGNGQQCALYGLDHGRELEQLARLKLPVGVRVRGLLGTEYHDGGTKENPSALVAGWTLYMDVHEVEVLNIDFRPKPEPGERR